MIFFIFNPLTIKELIRFLILIICLFHFNSLVSQTVALSVNLSSVKEICEKGSASIAISGGKAPYSITWSNGSTDVTTEKDLKEGDYTVTVKDSVLTDTTIAFKISKEECPVIISKFFSPNSDGYNDTWQIGQIQYYPEFEIYVYNKWGQLVHSQKNTYIPWDGDWNGVKTPDGTYYYVFFFKGSDKDNYLKGDVSLLR